MQRYFSKHKEDDYLLINNDDMYHITKVMRMKDDDKIEVVYDNELYICKVNLNECKAKIVKKEDNKKDIYEFNIIIPLLKEQKLDLIFQKATELGVNNIYLIDMERSIISLNDEKLTKKVTRWSKICKEAAEQSKRLDIPCVTYLSDIKDLESLSGNKIVCSTKKNLDNIRIYLKNKEKHDKINVVIGPEGGISDLEEKRFNDLGFESVSLGDRILRVETVPIYILSILNYEYME